MDNGIFLLKKRSEILYWQKGGLTMKKLFIMLGLISFSLWSAEQITIVKDRKPQAEIVIGEKPTKSVQFSALELQHIVQMMTGAKLPIVNKQTPG